MNNKTTEKKMMDITLICFLCAIVITGCERANLPTLPDNQPVNTFSNIQANILNQKCAGPSCHIGNPSPPFDLNMSEGNAYNNLVNVPSGWDPTLKRIEPGDPDNSFLVIKLEGTDSRLKGLRMPFNGPPFLSTDEINTIREWITEGAENN